MRANELEKRFEKLSERSRQINTVLLALERLSLDDSYEGDSELMSGLIRLASGLGRKLPSEVEYCSADVNSIVKDWRKALDELIDYRTGRKTAAGGGQ